jgi:hypothetical protein
MGIYRHNYVYIQINPHTYIFFFPNISNKIEKVYSLSAPAFQRRSSCHTTNVIVASTSSRVSVASYVIFALILSQVIVASQAILVLIRSQTTVSHQWIPKMKFIVTQHCVPTIEVVSCGHIVGQTWLAHKAFFVYATA